MLLSQDAFAALTKLIKKWKPLLNKFARNDQDQMNAITALEVTAALHTHSYSHNSNTPHTHTFSLLSLSPPPSSFSLFPSLLSLTPSSPSLPPSHKLVYKVLQAIDVGWWVTAGVGDISWLEGTQADDAARQVLLRRGCLVGNGPLPPMPYLPTPINLVCMQLVEG